MLFPVRFLVPLVLFAATFGCATPGLREANTTTGSLAVSASVDQTGDPVDLFALRVTLRKDRQVLEAEFPVHDGTGGGTLAGVPVGDWRAVLDAVDSAGDAIYRGEAPVRVTRGQPAVLHVVLQPAPGRLALTVELAGFPQADIIHKARLILEPGATHNFDRIPGTTRLQITRQLAPRTYDFRVDLYEDSFYAHKLVYGGYWEEVRIPPGKTVSLTWSPALGEVGIVGEMDPPPPTPAGLTAQLAGSAVLLTWLPVGAPDLAAYRLFTRDDPLHRPAFLVELHAAELSFAHDVSAYPAGTVIEYAVSAVDLAGLESPRSPPVAIQVP